MWKEGQQSEFRTLEQTSYKKRQSPTPEEVQTLPSTHVLGPQFAGRHRKPVGEVTFNSNRSPHIICVFCSLIWP